MNIYQFTLVTLVALAITPLAAAEIYKCDGPDGPIFSDQKCGADAARVQIEDTSGLSGVTEKTKADLAEKKLAREQARGSNNYDVVNNAQNNLNSTESPGRWVRGQGQVREALKDRPVTGRPVPVNRPAIPAGGRRR